MKDDKMATADNPEEVLHLKYMKTRKVGEVRERFNPEMDFQEALKRFEDRHGFDFVTYWMDKKIGVAEGEYDPRAIRELDSVAKKLLGDKQSTELKVDGLSGEERVALAKELSRSIVE